MLDPVSQDQIDNVLLEADKVQEAVRLAREAQQQIANLNNQLAFFLDFHF